MNSKLDTIRINGVDYDIGGNVTADQSYNASSTNAQSGTAVADAINGKVDKTTTVNGHTLSGNVTVTKSDVGLSNVTNDAQVKRSEMGTASGVATLDSAGKVPSSQLPSYVDDVLEYDTKSAFPATGEGGKIYVDKSNNTSWRWSGTAYVQIKGDLAIGTTTGTAADGGSASSHYANTSNPHSVTKAQVGLGSVVNTGDSATPVSGGTTKFTTGGAYTELAKKVDKVSGKGLSTNDYTTDEKNKLRGIASGAEVNQNAFSNVGIKVGNTTTTVAADAKTDTVTLIQGSNVTLTADTTNDTVTIAAKDTTYSAATTTAAGLMSADDKTKLNGIAAGAEVNVNADWNAASGDAQILNKPTIPAAVAVKGNAESSYRTGNVNITPANIGLGNVGNFKAVSTVASQGLTNTEKSNARSNIGAGTSSFSGSYNDLTNKPTSLPASDVYSWAKASTKPSYNLDEVSDGTTRKLANYLPLSGGTMTNSLVVATGADAKIVINNTDDETYYSKIKFQQKGEDYGYLGTVGTTAITWNGNEIYHKGNLTKLSQLTNDSGFTSNVGTITGITMNGASKGTSGVVNLGTVLTAHQDISGKVDKTTTVNGHALSGNVSVTKSDVGLGNVGNFKAVSTVASQGLSDTEKANARANIGAGTSSFSGSYNDLSNKPSIPAAAANGTYTIKTLVGSTTTSVSDFTANQSSADDLTIVQGANVTITPDATNRKITIAATNTNTWRPVSDSVSSTSSSDAASSKAVKTAYDLAASKTANTGTVTKVTAGAGLTGGNITTTGTIALATSGVTAGTYKRVTVDAYGRVTAGDNTDANDNTARLQVSDTTNKRINTKESTGNYIQFTAGTNKFTVGDGTNSFDVAVTPSVTFPVSSVAGNTGAVTTAQIATALTAAGYKLTDNNTTYNFSGTAFTSNNSTGVNADNVTYNAHTYFSSNGPGSALGASSDGALYSQAYNNSNVGQIAQDYRTGSLYVRGKNDGTWNPWYRVWDSRSVSGELGSSTARRINLTDDYTIPVSGKGGFLIWFSIAANASGTTLIPYNAVFSTNLFTYGGVNTSVFRTTAGGDIKIGSNGNKRDIIYIFIPFNLRVVA